MKKNFTLFILVFLMFAQNIKAKSVNGSFSISAFNYNKATCDTAPNQIYYSLYDSSISGDTSQLFTGASCQTTFDPSYVSNVYGPEDAVDFYTGFGENIAIVQGNNDLSIEGRSLPTVKDTIPLFLQGVSTQSYQLQVDATTFIGYGVVPYLYDAYLKTKTPLATAVNLYNFTPNADSVATYQNRFNIVFTTALPIKSILLNTTLKGSSVYLNWTTIGESDVEGYAIEKSLDGTHFSSIDNVAAKNTGIASYSYIDGSVAYGNNFYRIKATNYLGQITYSAVSTIDKTATSTKFGIYPNPVKNGTVNFKFTDVENGSYVVIIYNSLGQRITTKQIQHNGGDAIYSFGLESSIENGLYKVSVLSINSGKAVYESNLLIQK